MAPTLDTWCTRFAAGAGTEYLWQLTSRGILRAVFRMDEVYFTCPIGAQYMLETGVLTTPQITQALLVSHGLSLDDAHAIATAADVRSPSSSVVQALRTRLLRICRLAEES